MTSATDHQTSPLIKLILVGNSGAGKTGALTSLLEAGYKIRVIDLDSGLDALINHAKHADEKLLDQLQYNTFRDRIKMSPTGPKVVGAPKAYAKTLEALESWPDDKSDPAQWGADTILVIDSLTHLGRAAFQWAKGMNPTSKDPRQWYKTAQDLVEDLVANLTSEEFATNVIVISHVDTGETSSGLPKHFVSSIGKALGPKLPSYFNTLLLSETSGFGANVKRRIKTMPTAMLDVKNPAPMRIEAEYEIKDGLAKIFKELKK